MKWPTQPRSARVLQPGAALGRYRIVQRIASGGMAEVYLAQVKGPEGFRKLVAVKIVLPHLSHEQSFVDMFLNEARLAARLAHPNIAAVTDLGCEDGEYFIAMEFVRGADLRTIMSQLPEGGDVPLDCALTVVTGAAAALHHAHEMHDERGRPLEIIHRDVSLSNVLVGRDGTVKLVDFGIAKAATRTSVTVEGVLKGKIGYMSPEQSRGRTVDRRTDVYGLGIILYELTTQRRLFDGPNQFAILNRVLAGDFERPSAVKPDYPSELERIVLKALAAESDDRYATASELSAALEEFALSRGLSLSARRLGEFVTGLLGEEAPLVIDIDDGVSTSPSVPPVQADITAEVSVQKRRRWLAPVALGAAAIGIAGVVAIGGDEPEPAAELEPAAPESSEPRARPEPPVKTSPATPAARVREPNAAAPTEPAAVADPKPDAATRGPRRKRGGKRPQRAGKPTGAARRKGSQGARRPTKKELDEMWP